MSKIAIIGNGVVGKAYIKVFPEAYVFDEPQGLGTREEVNKCDMAIVAVPTNAKEDGSLDMSIVEDVVSWIESPLILIKSALMPGTTDYLVKKYNKNIAVSVEMIGEGNYFIPFWKYPSQTDPASHNFLIVGGEEKVATACANILWSKMSPDINIHILTAVETEICKLMENCWGALKVTYSNVIFDICKKYDANFIRVLQAWGVDGRTEKMHMRVTPGKRGWRSKCFDKDIPALGTIDESGFVKKIVETNKGHLLKNGPYSSTETRTSENK